MDLAGFFDRPEVDREDPRTLLVEEDDGDAFAVREDRFDRPQGRTLTPEDLVIWSTGKRRRVEVVVATGRKYPQPGRAAMVTACQVRFRLTDGFLESIEFSLVQ